jgi:hypothetical protein
MTARSGFHGTWRPNMRPRSQEEATVWDRSQRGPRDDVRDPRISIAIRPRIDVVAKSHVTMRHTAIGQAVAVLPAFT